MRRWRWFHRRVLLRADTRVRLQDRVRIDSVYEDDREPGRIHISAYGQGSPDTKIWHVILADRISPRVGAHRVGNIGGFYAWAWRSPDRARSARPVVPGGTP